MFWETLWPLVLGFGLSGRRAGVRVPRSRWSGSWATTGPLPWSGPAAFGMVSSSCSYAATAMAKSLFQKGADFVAAMVFMFASTNLVIELGIVLVVLMGWQFAVGRVRRRADHDRAARRARRVSTSEVAWSCRPAIA